MFVVMFVLASSEILKFNVFETRQTVAAYVISTSCKAQIQMPYHITRQTKSRSTHSHLFNLRRCEYKITHTHTLTEHRRHQSKRRRIEWRFSCSMLSRFVLRCLNSCEFICKISNANEISSSECHSRWCQQTRHVLRTPTIIYYSQPRYIVILSCKRKTPMALRV